MLRPLAAVVGLLLVGATVSAAEPDPLVPPSEHAAADKLDSALAKLRDARRKYEFVRTSVVGGLVDRLDPVRVRLADCEVDVMKAREALRAATVELRMIALVWAVRNPPELVIAFYTDLADRTQLLTGDRKPEAAPLRMATTEIVVLRKWLTKPTWPPPDAIADITKALDGAIAEASAILGSLEESLTLERLKNLLLTIRMEQARIREELHPRVIGSWPTSKGPSIGSAPEVVLAKGGRATVRHTITWNLYKHDELGVVVVASDPSLVVPKTLQLDFEKHQFRFEYEIKAGDKEGSFTVTLTPAAGNVVEVKVIVK